jgi:NADH dehydrogenase
VLRAKAMAEGEVRASGVAFTILRAAIVFGRGDGLTTGLAQLLASNPFFFFLPGDGNVLLQPLWVEDLVTALVWALDDPNTRNQLYEVGGPEFLSFRQIVEFVMAATGQPRRLIGLPPPYLRGLTVWLDARYPRLPVSVYWLDYLAMPRTCALDTLPRQFNLMPARFSKRLAYLEQQDWRAIWRANTARPSRRRSAQERT